MNIDIIIVVVFLTVTLLIGLYKSSSVTAVSEYALGNRNFSTATLVATIVATWVSGSDFFTYLAEAYDNGLYFIWAAVGDVFCLLCVGIFFAPRMAEFLGKLSIAEAMGEMYGKNVRIITAIAGCIGTTGIIAVQLKVSGLLFKYCFGIDENYGILIGGSIITLYATFGGIKSVTITDLIQLITFGTIIPSLGFLIFETFDNAYLIVETLSTNELFDYKKVFDFSTSKALSYLFLFMFIAVPGFNPAIFQRISMAKDTSQVRKSFIVAAMVCMVITFIMSWIGILILSSNSGLGGGNVVNYILDNFSYNGLRGLTMVGIIAMVMSTADSYINSTSILIVHDLVKSVGIKIETRELFYSKVASLIIGIFSIILALTGETLLNLIILTNSFYLPVVTVPFILSIMGFRSSSKSVLIGMSGGLSAVLIGKFFLQLDSINSVIPGMIMNLILLLSSHYLLKQKGGWVGIKDEGPLKALREERKAKYKRIWLNLRSFNLFTVLKQNTPKGEGLFLTMGLFVMISVFSSVTSLPKESLTKYSYLLDIFYPITLCTSTALISYPLWLENWKRSDLMSFVWNIIIFTVLICFSFLMVLISNFSEIQLMAFMVNIIVISSLIRWQWAMFTITCGVVIITLIYKNYLVIDSIESNFLSSQFKIVYLLLLISSSMVIFLKPKQEEQERAVETIDHLEEEVDTLGQKVTNMDLEISNLDEQVTHYSQRVSDQEVEIQRLGSTAQRILNNVNHELRLPVGNVINFAEMLSSGLEKYDKDQLKMLTDEVYQNSTRLSSMILNMLDLATLDVKRVDLQKHQVNFSELVLDRVTTCRKIYLKNKKIDIEMDIEPDLIISIDPNYIRQTVDNLVINGISYSDEGTIRITVIRTKNGVEFTISDQGIGIPKEEIYDVFTPFKIGSKTATPASGRGIGLSLCKRAVEAHDGSISVNSSNIGATFKFILPVGS